MLRTIFAFKIFIFLLYGNATNKKTDMALELKNVGKSLTLKKPFRLFLVFMVPRSQRERSFKNSSTVVTNINWKQFLMKFYIPSKSIVVLHEEGATVFIRG